MSRFHLVKIVDPRRARVVKLEKAPGRRTAITGYWVVRLAAIALVLFPRIAHAQAKEPAAQPAIRGGGLAGKRTFNSRCAGCHGLDGRGGERAPNIATNPDVRRLSDVELARVIFNGKPDFGMPALRAIGRVGIQKVVDYLRVLQGKGAAMSLAGNPQKGKAIFFGKADCSSCHMVNGQGGVTGSDLSTYASGLTPDEIRKAITDPQPPASRTKAAVATARDGQRLSGMVRNEDNFSVQLQSSDGAFYLLQKAELQGIEYQAPPLMPTDYGQRLTRQELDDLAGYLQSLKPDVRSGPEEEE